MKWCFLWRKESNGSTKYLHELFDIIPIPIHSTAWVLQIDCDSTTTSKSPVKNVLSILSWDPLAPKDKFLKRIMHPLGVFSQNPSDVEYCVLFL
jgi:hypothetical protein